MVPQVDMTACIRVADLMLTACVLLSCSSAPRPPVSSKPTAVVRVSTDIGMVDVPPGWSVSSYRGPSQESRFVLVSPTRYARIQLYAVTPAFVESHGPGILEFLAHHGRLYEWPQTLFVTRLAMGPCRDNSSRGQTVAICAVTRGGVINLVFVDATGDAAFWATGGLEQLSTVAASASDLAPLDVR